MGFVEDMKEARIQEANIRLINTQTGTENDSKTNEVGAFLLAGILPGSYTLQVEREGFATIQVREIVLNVGETKNLLIRMKVGQALESVVVDGTQMALSTTSDSVNTIINHSSIENSPIDGRSLQQLFRATPGIVGQSPQALLRNPGTEGDLSVNGQSTQANWYIVDGVSGNFGATYPLRSQQVSSSGQIPSSTALGTTHSLASLDALEEFRVSSSAFAAEYGKTPGGQFALFTRSGTNRFHGTAYNYFRNSALDANDWFANNLGTGKAATHQNDFGATFGGPLRIPLLSENKGNSFFFLSYEGGRSREAIAPTLQYVPSLALRTSATSNMRALLDAFPQPTGEEIRDTQGNLTGLSPFIKKSSLPASLDAVSGRLDANLPSSSSIFLRYSYTPSYLKTRELSSIKMSRVDSRMLTLGITNQIATRGVNQFRLGYGSTDAILRSSLDNFGGASAVDFNRALGLTGSYSTAQATAFLQVDGVGDSKLGAGQSSNALHQWDIADTFTFLRGSHLLKSGFDIRRIASPIHPPDLEVEQNFFSREALQQGIASELLVTRNLSADPLFHAYSAYVQDDWKPRSRFVLSYGARWESNLAPSAEHGKLPYVIPQRTPWVAWGYPVSPQRVPLWRDSWFRYFAPRAGFSFELNRKERRETVFRFGSGVFYGSNQEIAAESFRSLGFTSTNYLQSIPLPAASSNYELSLQPEAAISHAKVLWVDRHGRLARYINWSLSLEQNLGREQTLIFSRVGASGWLQLMPGNLVVPVRGLGYVEVSDYSSDGEYNGSEYGSYQLKYQYKNHWGLTALLSYNYAESVDSGLVHEMGRIHDIQLPQFPNGVTLDSIFSERGNADLDVRQSFQGSLSWEIPRAVFVPATKALSGWAIDARVSGRKGFPLTPEWLQSTDQITGDKYHPLAEWSRFKPSYRHGREFPGRRILSGGSDFPDGAFPDTDGCYDVRRVCYVVPRNMLRGFGAFQINMALRKEFHWNDRLSFQFRVETFNLTNHPNFGYIDTNTSHAQFGRAIKMLNQSSGTVSPLYEQGGPRSFQLSVRAHF